MIETVLQTELLKQLAQLPVSKQQQVLDYARSLAVAPSQEAPVKGILRLAGCMTREEADEMLRAIEEDCERIDPDEW